MKAARVIDNQEMYIWLRSHNPKLAEKFITRKLDQATYDQLVAQLKRQKKSEDLKTLIDFSLPNSEIENERTDLRNQELAVTKQSSVAVRNVLKIKQNKDRYDAGLSLSTLMTEHKRKVLLNALTDQPLQNEDRLCSQKKMETYLESHEATPSVVSAASSNVPSTNGVIHQPSNTAKPALISVESEVSLHRFEPKWSDYQVMQSRWLHIQHQTKKLT